MSFYPPSGYWPLPQAYATQQPAAQYFGTSTTQHHRCAIISVVLFIVLAAIGVGLYFAWPLIFPSSSNTGVAPVYSSSGAPPLSQSNSIPITNPASTQCGLQRWNLTSVVGLEVGSYVQITYTGNVIAYEQGYITSIDPVHDSIMVDSAVCNGPSGVSYTGWSLTVLQGPMPSSTAAQASSTASSQGQQGQANFPNPSLTSVVLSPTSAPSLPTSAPVVVPPTPTSAPVPAPTPTSTPLHTSTPATSPPAPTSAHTSTPVASPTSAPPAATTQGLVAWFPLLSDFSNAAGTGVSIAIQGGSSCSIFTSNGWTQDCDPSDNPATLLMTSAPGESGDFSISFAVFVSHYDSLSLTFLSCNQGGSLGSTDCAIVTYTPDYHIMAVSLNYQGHGFGDEVQGWNSWMHFCITYQSSTNALSLYMQGELVTTNTITHATTNYGAPVLAGLGSPADTQANAAVASFQNWRYYSICLSASQVATLATADTPDSGTVQPLPPTTPPSVPSPTSTPATPLAPTSAPTQPPVGTGVGTPASAGANGWCIGNGYPANTIPPQQNQMCFQPPSGYNPESFCQGLQGDPSQLLSAAQQTGVCLCYLMQMGAGQYFQFPANAVYDVAFSIPNYAKFSLQFYDIVVDFNGANLNFVGPTIYNYSSSFGFYTDGAWLNTRGSDGYPNWGVGDAMINIWSAVTIKNLDITATEPTGIFNVAQGAVNIVLDTLSVTNIPQPWADSIETGSNVLLFFRGDNQWIEIKNCYFYATGGYGIFSNDVPPIVDVSIHHNTFDSTGADAICINTVDTERFNAQNWWIAYNTIQNAGSYFLAVPNAARQYAGAINFGFGVSDAGGYNVTIAYNTLTSNANHNIHIEGGATYVYIYGNTLSTPTTNNPPAWPNEVNNINVGGQWIEIVGNTFTGSPDAAIYQYPSSVLYCLPYSGPYTPTTGSCVHMPYIPNYLKIENNNFVSWGLNGGTQDFAMSVGMGVLDMADQIYISGNTYNDVWGTYNGIPNRYIWGECPDNGLWVIDETNIDINGQSQTLTTITGQGNNNDYTGCKYYLPSPGTPTLWMDAMNIMQQYVQQPLVPLSSSYGEFVQFAVSSMTDIVAGVTLSQSNSASRPQWLYSPDASWGTPGPYFTPGQSLSTGSVQFGSGSDYSIVLAVMLSSTSNAIIVGSPNGGVGIGVHNGVFSVYHQGVWATGSSPSVSTANAYVVGLTYSAGSGTITWYSFAVACGSQTIGATPQDTSGIQMGSSTFQGWIFDFQYYNHALSASTIQSNLQYTTTSIPVVCFAVWQVNENTNNQCNQFFVGQPNTYQQPWSSCPTGNS